MGKAVQRRGGSAKAVPKPKANPLSAVALAGKTVVEKTKLLGLDLNAVVFGATLCELVDT